MQTKKREVGKRYYFTYFDVDYDKDGYVNPKEFLPLTCDMVTLKIISSYDGSEREVNGWWTGFQWEGLHLRKEDKIIAWRLNQLSDVQMGPSDFPMTKNKQKRLVIGKAAKVELALQEEMKEKSKEKIVGTKNKRGPKPKYRRITA